MNEKKPFDIGSGGRFMIFSGAGMVFFAVSMYLLKPLEHAAGACKLLSVNSSQSIPWSEAERSEAKRNGID
jgi:hypothetical protein